jgi:MFS transporter, UMF1 family
MERRNVPLVIWSWALYDWANSAFNTLISTFIYSTYFTQAMAPDEVRGTLWWSRAVALSGILTALVSPVLGAAADRAGTHKRFLAIATTLCLCSTALLAFVRPSQANAVLIALGLYVVADLCFETGYVFYNAFLPRIASPDQLGRVSGYGWGLGYVGGLVCMGIALVGFVQPDVPWFGITKVEGFNVRATNLLVAAWFAIFSLPLFLFVPQRRTGNVRVDLARSMRELSATLREISRYREIVKFLIARLVFNDGLVTIFAFGGIYAAGTFGMSLSEVIAFGVVLNVAAGLGAIAFGFLDDRIGARKTILITIAALSMATGLAVWAPSRSWLWLAGILIGVFVGPNQSASRSLMARFVPEKHQAEFFGFFAFSGKVTSFLGPIVLGMVTSLFQSQRAGVSTIILFFLVGGVLMMTVDERRGIAAARGQG